MNFLDKSRLDWEDKVRQKKEEDRRKLEQAERLAEEAEARRKAEEQARIEAEQRRDEQARSAKKLRWLLAGLAIAFLFAAGLAFFAMQLSKQAKKEKNRAEKQATEAKYQARIATSRLLVASAWQEFIQEKRERAALLVRHAYLLLPEDRDTSVVQGEIDKALNTIFRTASITEGPYEKLSLVDQVCEKVKHTVTLGEKEWRQLVGAEIPYQQACPKLSETEPLRLRSDPMTATDWQALSLNIGQDRRPVEDVDNRFDDRGDVVFDSTTGLMWQKSGAPKPLPWDEANTYCTESPFHELDGWRLPTLEELLSLLEQTEKSTGETFRLSERLLEQLKEGEDPVPEALLQSLKPLAEQGQEFDAEANFLNALYQHAGKDAVRPYQQRLLDYARNSYSLYIDPVFDSKQWWIWSADINQIKDEGSAESAWYVHFVSGLVYWLYAENRRWVRCVRP